MRLTLTIENQTNLPDGGSLTYSVAGARGFDIGRDSYLDWVLPDPSRFISGKHCEIRPQGGEYLLYDVSRNGTFLNGAQQRMQSPHRLRTGDRLSIGHYIVAVVVEGVAERPEDFGSGAAPPTPVGDAMWDFNDAAPPVDQRSFRADLGPRVIPPDFHDSAADPLSAVPTWSQPPPLPPVAPPSSSFSDWDAGPPRAVPTPPAPPPIPRPRPQVSGGPGGVWASPSAPSSAPQPLPSSTWDDEPVPAKPPAALSSPPPVSPPPAVPSFEPPVAPSFEPPPPMPALEQRAAEPPASREPDRRAGSDDFVRRFAAAAGIAPEIMARVPPEELADRLGQLMRMLTGEMMQLLSARSDARRMTRSSSQTVVQALDNNPLKFAPSPEEALAILFGPPTRSYLDAQRAFKAGFADLKTHQLKTYAAMQQAARRLGDDLSPKTIEASLPSEGGLAGVIGGRRSRLWDTYAARWAASAERHDGGLADVFMQYFAECYDRT
ncbi:type VI secretion system-associated FHA domain protein TagH [uncultured Alsobacter sp.]|uniref:type VI secretion system-associated FHA domain protein TagH n=1 Tax=uncultured Alsobacter sp. TaxID=1748258 RepID=UPI0025EC7AC8|nr:type VI secretion system-associated FHA domain protein TagH [uncultured Alsobacter sp.]